jgi:probable F420-dependent oxidoreductase
MKIGVTIFSTEYAIDPVELGKRLEDLGFESLFLAEHTHIPASRRTPFPGGGELPREYSWTYDPFLTLTAIAGATERLLLATGVCLVTERDPLVTAKAVSTLDHFSNGRFLFGVGAGWNEDELENHGTDPKKRWKVLRERVEAMRELWTADSASYHGETVEFDDVWQWPKPRQKPHPPVLLGASTPKAIERAVRYCDGWMPSGLGGVTEWGPLVSELRERFAEAGKPTPSVSIYGAAADMETLKGHAAAGVDRAILRLPSAPAAEIVPLLKKHAALMAAFT